MEYRVLHKWDLPPERAIELQKEMVKLLVFFDEYIEPVRYIAGVDISYRGDMGVASIVVMEYPSLRVVEKVFATKRVTFPYIPGLLVFREGPVFLDAWEKLKTRPDIVIFDGQGIAHPRGIGIASHMGLWIGLPTFGVAKSKLYGTYSEPGTRRGSVTPLTAKGKVIGAVVRTKDNVKPVFVSQGFLVPLRQAVELTLRLATKYRLPEPTRLAHVLSESAKRELKL